MFQSDLVDNFRPNTTRNWFKWDLQGKKSRNSITLWWLLLFQTIRTANIASISTSFTRLEHNQWVVLFDFCDFAQTNKNQERQSRILFYYLIFSCFLQCCFSMTIGLRNQTEKKILESEQILITNEWALVQKQKKSNTTK